MNAENYYDKFSKVYDLFSSKHYYHKARKYAIERLELKPNQAVLNIPCGTGQNLEYFQTYLKNSGLIIGIDLSSGMLSRAENKCVRNEWTNTRLLNADILQINKDWISEKIVSKSTLEIDSILCDLGLSGFPTWEKIIDNLLSILKPNGKIVIMDWYINKPSFRGEFVKWIGKGEVNRPLWQYLETKVNDFDLNNTFNRNGVFVASGRKYIHKFLSKYHAQLDKILDNVLTETNCFLLGTNRNLLLNNMSQVDHCKSDEICAEKIRIFSVAPYQ